MRWILRIVFGLIALAGLAVAVLFLLPAERIAGLVTDRFEAATGRAMTLQGDVRPTLWPELGVNLGPLTIANADWSDAGPMIAADGLSAGVDIMALLGGEVRIRRVELKAPVVVLEVGRDGRGNWEMARNSAAAVPSAGAAAESGGIPAFSLDRAVISDGTLRFIDRASGSRTELTAVDATLSLPAFDGALDLDLAARMNGQAFAVTAQVAEFAAFLGAGAVPVTMRATVGGSQVDFAGRAGLDPMAAGGRLTAELDDMAALFALVGQAAPQMPRGLGRTVGVTGDVTADGAGRMTLRDGTIRLDHNTLSGAVDLTLSGVRPRVVATLASGALDLSEAVTGESGGTASGTGAPSASGWSRAPIDVSGLQAVDAEIALAAASVNLGAAQLGRTSLFTALDQGRAVTEIREMQAYDGTVTGTLVLNSRGGLSTRADLRGKGVRLKPLLVQLFSWDRLQTTGDVSVNLLGVGNSVDALMNSWNGDGSVRFGAGELAGLDLVGMLRTLDASYVGAGAKTIFDSIGATFTVENGVVTNADLTFLAPLLTASGKGRVGLGGRTIDYRLEPRLLEGQTGGGIRVPVLITGTWSNPKFRLDLESLAEERIEVEVEKVKEKAEEAVIQRLNEELGVTITDKADVDDVLKQELQERATKGLLDLLGGN